MRTNIDLADALLADAMEALGTHGKQETVEVAPDRDWKLRRIREPRGTVHWEGDLDEWRRSQVPDR